MKQKLGLDSEKFFQLSDDILNDFRSSYNYSREEVKAWNFNLNNIKIGVVMEAILIILATFAAFGAVIELVSYM